MAGTLPWELAAIRLRAQQRDPDPSLDFSNQLWDDWECGRLSPLSPSARPDPAPPAPPCEVPVRRVPLLLASPPVPLSAANDGDSKSPGDDDEQPEEALAEGQGADFFNAYGDIIARENRHIPRAQLARALVAMAAQVPRWLEIVANCPRSQVRLAKRLEKRGRKALYE
jgi:hypothetical protein